MVMPNRFIGDGKHKIIVYRDDFWRLKKSKEIDKQDDTDYTTGKQSETSSEHEI